LSEGGQDSIVSSGDEKDKDKYGQGLDNSLEDKKQLNRLVQTVINAAIKKEEVSLFGKV
jgi:hypothetical protein